MPTEPIQVFHESLEATEEADADVEVAWATEAERRWQEIESGKVKTIPWDEIRGSEFSNLTK